jgi:uncharacterized LabA/DUF88 family protein
LRVTFYVDGFNLYYGALKPTPRLKWLNLQALATALRPNDEVRVRYFTARVRQDPDPSAQGRQKLYILALETLPKVSIHFGRFRSHATFMPLVTPSPAGPRVVEVYKTQEKGSDVNLGTFLLLDGMDRLYDEAVVISGDSDLAAPVRAANKRFGSVHVLNPRPTGSRELETAAASYGQLALTLLEGCQFPNNVVVMSGRSVHRPPSWT